RASAMAVISMLLSGGLGEAAAGQMEVDVVDGRLARGERRDAELYALDLGDRVSRAAVDERDGHRRADDEGIGAGDASLAEPGEGGTTVPVDTELHELVAQTGAQSRGRVERDDAAGVHDRESIAQPFRFVEIVRRHEQRQVVATTQTVEHVQQLVAD